jgi:hypothetical protein
LNIVHAIGLMAQDGTLARFDGNDLNIWVLLLQITPGTSQGAAGANADDDRGNLSIGILPNFGAGVL